MHISIKTHWTDLRELLKAFPEPAFGIEFHENEIDIDDATRFDGQIGTIAALLSKRKNMAIAFHAPVLDTDPASFDAKVRKESIGRVKRTIALAASMHDKINMRKPIVNAHFFSLVHGTGQLGVHNKRRALRIAKESARILKAYAQKKNVIFTLENNPPILYKEEGKNVSGLFGRCAEDIIQCGCNSCLDISHAYMSCFYFENRNKGITLPNMGKIDRVFLPDVEADMNYCGRMPHSVKSLQNFVNALGDSISHVHLNDAIGYFHEGLVLGEGDIDFKRVLPLLGRGVMFVLEMKRAHLYPQKISESLDYLRKNGLLKTEKGL